MHELANLDEEAVGSYVRHAIAGDEAQARRVLEEALARGVPATALYLNVLVPAQHETGERWRRGEISVATEHLATEITLRLMERLRQAGVRKPSLHKRVVVACAPGDHHSVGARMVADFLYLDGWSVDFLGADVPASELAAFVGVKAPDLIALSVFQSEYVGGAMESIAAVRRVIRDTPVLLGGRAIANEDEARRMGAQGYARDALEAVAVARELVGVPAGMTLDQLLQTVGEHIQARRRALGWSQQHLATAAELDRTYVSTVENGRQNLTLSAVLRLANALNVTAADLLGDDDIGQA